MKRHLYSSVIVGFLMVMSVGCASKSCGERMTFREWFSNRPRPVMDLFNRGDECSTCAVHDGHVDSFDMGSEMSGGCATGNCMAPQGSIGSGVENFPADTATLAPNNRIRTNYPPAFAPGELASEKSTLAPISNAELENPPGYGRSN